MEALSPLVAANLHCLEQAIELLGRLPEGAFARTSERHARTVGPHLRHVLDHYSAFIAGLPAFRVDYDARAREPRLESDLEFAAARMREIVGELVLVEEDLMELPIQIRLESGGDGGSGAPKPSSGATRPSGASSSSCSPTPSITSL